MRLASFAAIAALAISSAAYAAPAANTDEIFAPARAFIAAVNKGDPAAAGDAFTPDATIVDEFGGFYWHGKDALAGWNADFGKLATALGISDVRITLAKPTEVQMSETGAYAIFPARIADKHKGKPTLERGAFTFTFAKADGSWRISSWTWTTKPKH